MCSSDLYSGQQRHRLDLWGHVTLICNLVGFVAIGHETIIITITIINHVVVPFGFTIRTPIEFGTYAWP